MYRASSVGSNMYQSRCRKRVHAIRRAPDGSAFQKCDKCGGLIAIALAGMHECEDKKGAKKIKGEIRHVNKVESRFRAQPRSGFRFFMESFVQTCEDGDEISIDRKGYKTWKSMPVKERLPYECQAIKVDSAYSNALLPEVDIMSQVSDEADSAAVGKCDENYVDYECCDSTEFSVHF